MSPTERDANGRFASGNSGGPGRASRTVEATYLKAILECVSVDDWKAVCQRALQDAIHGCHKSRQFLASYLIGPPRESIELIKSIESFEYETKIEEIAVESLSDQQLKAIDAAFRVIEQAEEEARGEFPAVSQQHQKH